MQPRRDRAVEGEHPVDPVQRRDQVRVEERPFTVAEAHDAAEAFITAASAFVTPVVEIDGKTLGDGTPGPLTRRLRELYIDAARASAT